MSSCLASRFIKFAAAFTLFLPGAYAGQQPNNTPKAKASGNAPDPSAKPTPHLPDGHPNLNGVWYAWAGHVSQGDPNKKYGETLKDGSVIATYAYDRRYNEQPASVYPARPPRAVPPYKSELMEKIKDLAARQAATDPTTYSCKPPGVPRIGPPQEIVHGDRELAFIYSDVNGNYWRIVPTDGRPHNADADPSYLGDSIGHWEGDTLVVDDTNFNDDTWFSNAGYFHSTALHVTERLTRKGDTLLYEVTVEDPKVLTAPWVLPPRNLQISENRLEEAPPCKDMDQPHFTNLDHH
jgi:hypothetical protein